MSRANIMNKLRMNGSNDAERDLEQQAEDESKSSISDDERAAIEKMEEMIRSDKDLDAALAAQNSAENDAAENEASPVKQDIIMETHIEMEEDVDEAEDNDVETKDDVDVMPSAELPQGAPAIIIEPDDELEAESAPLENASEADTSEQRKNHSKPKTDPFEEMAKALKQSEELNYGVVDNKYLKMAQSVLGTSTANVKALKLDDGSLINYVSDKNMKWIDDGKKVNLFNEELLESNSADDFCVDETVLIALAIAKEKGWKKIKFTAANDALAERLRTAAKDYGFSKVTVNVVEKPELVSHQEKKIQSSTDLSDQESQEVGEELDKELVNRLTM